MRSGFVDSNVFLQFFAKGDEAQRDRARRLFRAAEAGTVSLITGPPVLFEVVSVLDKFHRLEKGEILGVLDRILALPGLELTDRKLVEEAVRLARSSGQDFPDAYIAASARESSTDGVATFNRAHFETLGSPIFDF
jgi:predicted nucleic acid-binding protein